MSATAGIDPRGPRFGAAITAVLLLVAVWLGIGLASAPIDLEAPGYLLLVIISAIFLWGFLGGVQNHPYGLFFRKLIRPRLKAPEYVESPAGPTFAQGVGFVVTIVGVLLYLAGVAIALPIAAAAAFIAAFLNAAFGYCLGCEIYLLFARRGITFGLEKRGDAAPSRPGIDPSI
jgi:hypothetical protein